MKKIALMFAAALMAVSASAQTVEESKITDNIYIGLNGGVATKMTHNNWLGNLNANAGVRVGRWITPVFGLAVESNAYFNDRAAHKHMGSHTAVKFINTSLLGTVNLNNLFSGYKGQPRAVELIAVYGLGWAHGFSCSGPAQCGKRADALTSKAGLDIAYNFGSDKQWQVYIEPSVIWDLDDNFKGTTKNSKGEALPYYGNHAASYNLNAAMFQLNAGIVYKFKNSNGTHNFKIAQLRDQAEIDALNDQINALKAELAKKPKEVIKEVVKEAPAPKEVKVENLVFVTFAQGKSALTADAKAALDGVAEGSHVQIVGTASPEGSKELNDRLSQARADEVAKYLSDRGVVVDEATGKGVQGTTSNRLAIVYVK